VCQVKEYLGEEERTLVDFILRMLAEHRPPQDILGEVRGGERESGGLFRAGAIKKAAVFSERVREPSQGRALTRDVRAGSDSVACAERVACAARGR
jgi:hypothetical protein